MIARNTVDELFGQDAPDEHDLRVRSIGHTRHLDSRRYELGLYRIDRHMKPWRAGEFVIVGAREGAGKTSLAEHIALENSKNYRVLFTTLEMTREEIRDRMLAKLMRTSLDGVHQSLAEEDDDYYMAQALLNQRDLMVWHPSKKPDRTVQSITQRAMDVTADLLVIDYTRLITGWKPGDGATEVMDYLRGFVRQRSITTVLLTQLNRDAVGKRPNNGHFQDTGALEQAADRALLLWRPFLGNPKRDHVAEIIVGKNRGGPCFRSHAHWSGSTMDFHNMTEEEDAQQLCCKRTRKENE